MCGGLDAFDNVRPNGSGWSAKCPAHRDRKNSLSIGIGENGAVVVHCHAGCDPGMVLYHKGLQFQDLYPPQAGADCGQLGRQSAERRSDVPHPTLPARDEPKHEARVVATTPPRDP